ncbi:hypothetical protein AERO8C_140167 [Aeromonas veronii]|uniref:Uncharacterized protein n=1 Tax=Aeromonas veronii TaxID=654 RepID=A0A653KVB8_AERVE|nr:hypothetical protein AERO8C_140167 [Aeromonas veronii]
MRSEQIKFDNDNAYHLYVMEDVNNEILNLPFYCSQPAGHHHRHSADPASDRRQQRPSSR